MEANAMEQFSKNLLSWYDSHARVLPWRNNPTPYRVWISEIMLQQTRVDTVKPYFERFMREVPSVQDLADIPEEQLLKLWEGLGYYSRAKNLKKAAAIMVEKFGGKLPEDLDGLRSLPGIGPYSSGAIASIAYNKKATAVDGNVLRVMARVCASSGDIADSAVKKETEALVYKLLPSERVGDFNQALMELGATVCLPNGAPKCLECPVQSMCEAYKQGMEEALPVKAKKKERRVEQKTVFIIEHEKQIAIRQRGEEGLLSGLWEFPNCEGYLSQQESKEVLSLWGIRSYDLKPVKDSKHIFTHLEWHMKGYSVAAQEIEQAADLVWAAREEIKAQYTIPTAFKAFTKAVLDGKL